MDHDGTTDIHSGTLVGTELELETLKVVNHCNILLKILNKKVIHQIFSYPMKKTLFAALSLMKIKIVKADFSLILLKAFIHKINKAKKSVLPIGIYRQSPIFLLLTVVTLSWSRVGNTFFTYIV